MKNRKDSTRLPSALELREILEKESQRKPDPSKLGIHYPDFSSAIELLKAFSLSTSFLERDYTIEDLNSEELIEETERLIDELARKIVSSDTILDPIIQTPC